MQALLTHWYSADLHIGSEPLSTSVQPFSPCPSHQYNPHISTIPSPIHFPLIDSLRSSVHRPLNAHWFIPLCRPRKRNSMKSSSRSPWTRAFSSSYRKPRSRTRRGRPARSRSWNETASPRWPPAFPLERGDAGPARVLDPLEEGHRPSRKGPDVGRDVVEYHVVT